MVEGVVDFAKSERTVELVGFVSCHSKTRQLKGVKENYLLANRFVSYQKICSNKFGISEVCTKFVIPK